MNSQRNLLLIALLVVSFMIVQAWLEDKGSKLTSKTKNKTENTIEDYSSRQVTELANQDKLITVNTDVLKLTINTRGGDIERAELLAYPKYLGSSQPFQLLKTTQSFMYQAQSGLTGQNGPDNPKNGVRPLFLAKKDHYSLQKGHDELRIPLRFIDKNSTIYTKTFVLKRGDYAVSVYYLIDNKSITPIELTLFSQLQQTSNLTKKRTTSNNHFALHAFRGMAYSSSAEKYHKYKFDQDVNLNLATQFGWIAMLQQYFATAWIPDPHQGIYTFYASNLEKDLSTIGFRSTPVVVQPKEQKQLYSTLWVGPELQDKMAQLAPHLDLTVDYGWLWFISQPLFKLLKFIHGFVGNWGFSIIIITFIVRGIMYPLTKAQCLSIAKMRTLQPKIQAIRDRFGNNKQRMSQEIILLYKLEKVNPIGACLPVIIQMPIFLALYYMLTGAVELRHAPFILWISDLSSQDPCYILPILMGLTMFFLQKMSTATVADPIQKKIMTFMPAIFIFFFLWCPAGLVLYYIISNLVTILQHRIIYQDLERRGLHILDNKISTVR